MTGPARSWPCIGHPLRWATLWIECCVSVHSRRLELVLLIGRSIAIVELRMSVVLLWSSTVFHVWTAGSGLRAAMRRASLVLHLPLLSVPLRALLGNPEKLIELLLLSLIWPGLAGDAFALDDGLARYWGAIDVEGVSVATLARQCRLLDDHHLWVLGRALAGATAAPAESVWAVRQSAEASALSCLIPLIDGLGRPL